MSWVPCPYCDASGFAGEVTYEPCPRCSGLGELPSEGMIEAAAKAINDWYSGPHVDYTGEAGAALVAARQYELREK